MIKTESRAWLYCLSICVITLLLCGRFLDSPLLFDDQYFFRPGGPEGFYADGFQLVHRWWVYQTLAATFVFIGSDLLWLRLGNLLLHIATAWSIFFFIRRLLLDLDTAKDARISAEAAAFIAALFFAVHPLAIFTEAYLIQRTIVAATLFSLMAWLAFWQGLQGSRLSLWLSCIFVLLAVFAKEHAVMSPWVSLLLLILFVQSGKVLTLPRKEIAAVLFLQSMVSVFIILQMKGVIGQSYEIMTSEVLRSANSDVLAKDLYPLSVLSQMGLFFKYLALWMFPNSTWVAIDIREFFPSDFSVWTLWAGLVAFLLFASVAAFMLFRGGISGLLGFSMLGLCCMYFTEFAATRFQEPFVVYRSYLWMPLIFILFAIGFRRLSRNLSSVLIPLFFVYLTALSFDRLSTFAHPYLVWDEAAKLLERRSGASEPFGAYRIYYNRGTELVNIGKNKEALADLNHVLGYLPDYAPAYHQLGVIWLNLGDWKKARGYFEQAIPLQPDNIKSYLGLAKAFEESGDIQQKHNTLRFACSLGSEYACKENIR